LFDHAADTSPHLSFNFDRNRVNRAAKECVLCCKWNIVSQFPLNFLGSHFCKRFRGSRHQKVSKEHNEFHELRIIHVWIKLSKFSNGLSSHCINFGLIHWVILLKLNLERKSGWLSSLDHSFCHQEITVVK